MDALGIGQPRTKRLLGRIAIVIDAVSPVGAAVCDQLACEGAKVLLVDSDRVGATWRAKEINLLVSGLDPNFSDVGEDPWGAKQSAVPFQSNFSDPQDLIAVLHAATSTFGAPVDVLFDTLGSIDVRLLRDLSLAGLHLPTPSSIESHQTSSSEKETGSIVTVTTAELPHLFLPRQSTRQQSPVPLVERCLLDDAVCAHVFCDVVGWEHLKQLSDPVLDTLKRFPSDGCVELQCCDLFTPVAHLICGSGGLSATFDHVDNGMFGLGMPCQDWCKSAAGCQSTLIAVRFWPDKGSLTVGASPAEGNDSPLAFSCAKDLQDGNDVDRHICVSCEDSSISLSDGEQLSRSDPHGRGQGLQGCGIGHVMSQTGGIIKEDFGLSLSCRTQPCAKDGGMDPPSSSGREFEATWNEEHCEWCAYCGCQCPEKHPSSLEDCDSWAVSVGISAVNFTVRWLFVGYIAVTFAMPKVWDLYTGEA